MFLKKDPLVEVIKKGKFDVVLDIGACTGQTVKKLFDKGRFKGSVYAFEPDPENFKSLNQLTSKYKNLICYPVAISKNYNIAPLFRTKNNQCHSLKKVKDTSAFRGLKEKDTNVVITKRLDYYDFISYMHPNSKIFLKIDVQGGEYEVLQGANFFLEKAEGIQIECSVNALYEGVEKDFTDIIKFLNEYGFKVYSINPVSKSKTSSKTYEVDIIMLKEC